MVAATLPGLTFVDVAHFDNAKNPAWLDKCEDKSWYKETSYAGAQFVQVGYADDAAAGVGGLTQDDIYKTAGGALRIKL